MTFLQEEAKNKTLLERMKKWGIIKEEDPLNKLLSNLLFTRLESIGFAESEPVDIIKELRELERKVRLLSNEVAELKKRLGGRRKPTKADLVYEQYKAELEKRYFGKIVAIDTDLGEIVGVGDTILEAYEEAKKKTGKDKFDFRRVGFKYVFKV